MDELSVLNRFSNELEKEALDRGIESERKAVDQEEISDLYLNMLVQEEKKGTVYRMVFVYKEAGDALVSYDSEDQICYKILPEDLYINRTEDSPAPAVFIGREMNVRVKEVDFENRIVYMRYSRISARVQINDELESTLKNAKAEGRSVRIKAVGKVIKVFPRYAMINIADKGVIGYIHVANWSEDYTRDLTYVLKVGDTYTYDIVDMRESKIGLRTFQLDHKPYSISVWKKIPENFNPYNTTIQVRCIEIDVAKCTWIGTVASNQSLLPMGMEVYGYYKQGKDALVPELGQTYLCTVTSFNRERKSLAVTLYRSIRETTSTIKRPVPVR